MKNTVKTRLCGIVSSRLTELFVFVIIFCLCSGALLNVFIYKSDVTVPRLYNIYDGDYGRADVLVIGSSHAGHVLNNVLWDEYGIASYSIINNSQPAEISYYSVKEFLRFGKPSVVMLETMMIPDNSIWEPDTVYEADTTGDSYFRYSLNYISMVLSQIGEYGLDLKSEGIPLLLKWPMVHARYNELGRDDFTNTAPYTNIDLDPSYSTPDGEVLPVSTDERYPMSPTGEKYLRRTIELCRRKNIRLILFHTPYPAPEISLMQQNTISDIAREEGVTFLDFNHLLDEAGIVFDTDLCRDRNHINLQGSEKVTRFLGDYLKENAPLADRRGDERYDCWNKGSRVWADVAVKKELEAAENYAGYMDVIGKIAPDFTVIISLGGNFDANPGIPASSDAIRLGAGESIAENGGTLVLSHGEVMRDTSGDKTYRAVISAGGTEITLERKRSNKSFIEEAAKENDNDRITVFGEDQIKAVNGVSITVFDDSLGEVIDSVGVDVYMGDAVLRDRMVY